jgi:hypothetical protein
MGKRGSGGVSKNYSWGGDSLKEECRWWKEKNEFGFFEEYELGNNGDVKVGRRGEANKECFYLVDFYLFFLLGLLAHLGITLDWFMIYIFLFPCFH